jgi:hypothetical protein
MPWHVKELATDRPPNLPLARAAFCLALEVAGRAAGLAASIQARLVLHAHALKIEPNLVLARYAAERLLYRLSRSPYADRFVLKGALMLLVWLGEAIRPTRDADLLGFGNINPESLREIFTELCVMRVEPDGLESTSLPFGSLRFESKTPTAASAPPCLHVWAPLGSRYKWMLELAMPSFPTRIGSNTQVSWICQTRGCGLTDRRPP